MSRASAAGFADFFQRPLALQRIRRRSGKGRKSKALDSPSATPVNHQQEAKHSCKSRDENVHQTRPPIDPMAQIRNQPLPILDNSESPQGDLTQWSWLSKLSCKHQFSSVFSAPPATTTFGGPSNLNPLTTADSSHLHW